MFDQNLSRNLYKLWNRMSSGSYLPPPVKQVEIPKAKGGTRKLGIPTVSDRIAQTVVKRAIEPILDPIFHPDSYGYRPGRSAKQAIAVTRKRCWRYDWVVEFDIKAAFDQIDHGLLMKAVRSHIKEGWILLYIERWLNSAVRDCGRRAAGAGTRYAARRGGLADPDESVHALYVRCLDAAHQSIMSVCALCRRRGSPLPQPGAGRRGDAVHRIAAGGMRVDDASGKVEGGVLQGQQPYRILSAYALHVPRFYVSSEEGQRQSEPEFTSFLPGVSADALKRMRKVVRGWRIHRQTPATLAELAKQYNPAIRGWWNYFGAFYRTAMHKLSRYIDQRLEQWARRKYKTLLRHKRRSVDWLRRMKNESPRLFYHWSVVGEKVG